LTSLKCFNRLLTSLKKYSLLLFCIAFQFLITACGNRKHQRTYTDQLYSTKGGKTHVTKKDTVKESNIQFQSYDFVTHNDSFQKLSTYRIALLLPFNIDSLYPDSSAISYSSIPRGIYPALDFYEGALIALDSLKHAGLNLELQVVDYSSTQHQSFETIAKTNHLSEMDLLIGTLSSADSKPVAEYALQHQILFVSPLANSFTPTHNPFYLSLNPSLLLQQQKLAQSISTQIGNNARVLIIHPATSNEVTLAKTYASLIAELPKNEFKVTDVLIQANTPRDSIRRFLAKYKKNALIICSNESNYIYPIIRKLNDLADSTSITVFGMPSWNNLENLKNATNRKLDVYYANTYSVDRSTASFTRFNRVFIDHYKIRPSELAIRGYNTLLTCGTYISTYGVRFHYFINGKNIKNHFGSYQIKPLYSKESKNNKHYIQHFYNAGVNLIKLSNKSLIRINPK